MRIFSRGWKYDVNEDIIETVARGRTQVLAKFCIWAGRLITSWKLYRGESLPCKHRTRPWTLELWRAFAKKVQSRFAKVFSSIIHRFPHSISTNILTSSYGAILEQEMRNKISRLHTCVCSNFFSKGQMKWAHPFSIWIFVIYTGHDESSIFLLWDPSQVIVTFLMSRCIPHVHEFYPP